jgi:hypothetical protein
VPQGVDGTQAGGAAGRVEAEEDASITPNQEWIDPRFSAHCFAFVMATRIAIPSSWPSARSALAISIAFERTTGGRFSIERG